MSVLFLIAFVSFCVYNFIEGYKKPSESKMIVQGDYYPIGKIIRDEPKTSPVRRKRKPEKPKVVRPAILNDCVLAAKSLGFSKFSKKEVENFILDNSISTVEEFIVEVTRKKN